MSTTKHQIADQLNAGTAPADIDGYDAARTATVDNSVNCWARELANGVIYEIAAFPAVGVWAQKHPTVGQWRTYALASDEASADASRIGAGYGIDGQIWDNA